MFGIAFAYDSSIRNVCSGSEFAIDLMRESARAFNITDMVVVDTDNLNPFLGDASINSFLCKGYEFLPEKYNDWTKVVIEAELKLINESKKYTMLKHFKHPKEPVLYIVGSDSQGLSSNNLSIGSTFVSIEQPGSTSMWSVSALMIVLHDRYLKRM